MSPGSECDDLNDAASSLSLLEKTTETLTSPSTSLSSFSSSSGDSLHAPPLLTLPFDLVLEILCWLPVKSLLKIRCVCKSWNSIISDDPKFAKKHLHMSAKRNCHHHLIASSRIPGDKFLIWDSPISSVFSAESATTSITQTKLRYPPILNQLRYPPILNLRHAVVCSCHGILCFLAINHYAIVWNPSVRKFKIFPCLESPRQRFNIIYGFGYDHFNDNYKVIAIFCYGYGYNDDGVEVSRKTQVKVHTLGSTNSWRMIEEFPSGGVPVGESGKFVSGTVNWVASTNASEFSSSRFIVSLDLSKESYQEILQPDYGGVDVVTITLGVLRDCLCIFAHSKSFIDVWLMKEYGNKDSWTKLFGVPYIRDLGFFASTKVVYIHEDDQVLLVSRELVVKSRLFVYDSRNDIFNIFNIQNINGWMGPKVYVESLILP